MPSFYTDKWSSPLGLFRILTSWICRIFFWLEEGGREVYPIDFDEQGEDHRDVFLRPMWDFPVNVLLNPPFSEIDRHLELWLEVALFHSCFYIVIVPHKPGEKWWSKWEHHPLVCMLHLPTPLQFSRGIESEVLGSAPQPTTLVFVNVRGPSWTAPVNSKEGIFQPSYQWLQELVFPISGQQVESNFFTEVLAYFTLLTTQRREEHVTTVGPSKLDMSYFQQFMKPTNHVHFRESEFHDILNPFFDRHFLPGPGTRPVMTQRFWETDLLQGLPHKQKVGVHLEERCSGCDQIGHQSEVCPRRHYSPEEMSRFPEVEQVFFQFLGGLERCEVPHPPEFSSDFLQFFRSSAHARVQNFWQRAAVFFHNHGFVTEMPLDFPVYGFGALRNHVDRLWAMGFEPALLMRIFAGFQYDFAVGVPAFNIDQSHHSVETQSTLLQEHTLKYVAKGSIQPIPESRCWCTFGRFLVPEPDKQRPIVNMRPLNPFMYAGPFCLPEVAELLLISSPGQLVFVADIKSAFEHLDLFPSEIPLTTFAQMTPQGWRFFAYTVAAFGGAKWPQVMQWVSSEFLRSFVWLLGRVYIDDFAFVLQGSQEDDIFDQMHLILEMLFWMGLRMAPKMAILASNEPLYLGRYVNTSLRKIFPAEKTFTKLLVNLEEVLSKPRVQVRTLCSLQGKLFFCFGHLQQTRRIFRLFALWLRDTTGLLVFTDPLLTECEVYDKYVSTPHFISLIPLHLRGWIDVALATEIYVTPPFEARRKLFLAIDASESFAGAVFLGPDFREDWTFFLPSDVGFVSTGDAEDPLKSSLRRERAAIFVFFCRTVSWWRGYIDEDPDWDHTELLILGDNLGLETTFRDQKGRSFQEQSDLFIMFDFLHNIFGEHFSISWHSRDEFLAREADTASKPTSGRHLQVDPTYDLCASLWQRCDNTFGLSRLRIALPHSWFFNPLPVEFDPVFDRRFLKPVVLKIPLFLPPSLILPLLRWLRLKRDHGLLVVTTKLLPYFAEIRVGTTVLDSNLCEFSSFRVRGCARYLKIPMSITTFRTLSM